MPAEIIRKTNDAGGEVLQITSVHGLTLVFTGVELRRLPAAFQLEGPSMRPILKREPVVEVEEDEAPSPRAQARR
jgi:hypothetical protein